MNETVDNAESQVSESTQEVEASKMGWVPEDKFRGDKSRWVDAKTFIERGEQFLPIVKAELRKTREELAQVQEAAKEFQAMTQQAKEREVGEWKAKYEGAIRAKKEALDQGNGEAFIEAEATQRDLEANRPQPKQEVKVDPEFAAWRGENSWYGKDVGKTLKANAIGYELAESKGLRGRALYEAVNAELEGKAREAEGTERGSPQRGGRASGTQRTTRSYENLKPDFRKACDNMVKRLNIKREDYIAKCDDDAFGA